MTVMTITSRLRWAITGFCLGSVLFPIQKVLVGRLSLSGSQGGILPLLGWQLIALAIVLILVGGIARRAGSFWPAMAGLVAVGWILSIAWFSAHMRSPALGFFSLFLALYFGPLLAVIFLELRRPYYGAQIPWYQGSPRAIPGLACTLNEASFRISKVDHEGFFAFNSAKEPSHLLKKAKPVEVRLSFRDRVIAFSAIPVVQVQKADYNGVGLMLSNLVPDQQKRVADFIEKIRGEGYGE